MMTMALILLFVLEFALLGYACIQKLQKYKSKLVGFIIALSLSAGKCPYKLCTFFVHVYVACFSLLTITKYLTLCPVLCFQATEVEVELNLDTDCKLKIRTQFGNQS